MNLFYLRYFVKLAQVRHYTRAAQQLCITQPSLSHAISQLEEELGVPLFEKNGHNITLTRFGEEFLSCAEHTLSALDEGIASLQRSARGEGLIRLGLLRTLGIDYIPRLTAAFLAAHPGQNIQFTFHTGTTRQLTDGLKAHAFDLLFCSLPYEKLDITAVPVKSQDLVVIVPPGHPLADRKTVSAPDLLPYPFIYFSRDSGLRASVDQVFSETDAAPPMVCETEEDQVIAGLVAHGFGISVVPYMDLLQKLDVTVLRLDSPHRKRDFFMIHDNQTYMPPAVWNFRQFVLDRTIQRY